MTTATARDIVRQDARSLAANLLRPGRNLPFLPAEKVVHSTKEWGETVRGADIYEDHLCTHLVMVPEGQLTVLHCSRCGGHWELLHDHRGRTLSPSGPGDLPPRVRRDIAVRMGEEAADEQFAFRQSHRTCQPAARLKHWSPKKGFFAARVASLLSSRDHPWGRPIPTLYLLTSKGRRLLVPLVKLSALPSPWPRRRAPIEIEASKQALRDALRRKAVDVELAITAHRTRVLPAGSLDREERGYSAGVPALELRLATPTAVFRTWIPGGAAERSELQRLRPAREARRLRGIFPRRRTI